MALIAPGLPTDATLDASRDGQTAWSRIRGEWIMAEWIMDMAFGAGY